MKMTSVRVALFATAATVLFASTVAAAKDGPAAPAADPAAAPAPAPQVDAPQDGTDIIITSTKSNERQRDVPASVSVITATDLTKQGSVRFTDYASRVPGLSLTSARTGITQITLRGITTGSSQPGSTTGFYLDDAVGRIVSIIKQLTNLVVKNRPMYVRIGLPRLLNDGIARYQSDYRTGQPVGIENALGEIPIDTNLEIFEDALAAQHPAHLPIRPA